MIVLVIFIGIISGCNTTNDNNEWPYQGVPTIGTNQIPIPHY